MKRMLTALSLLVACACSAPANSQDTTLAQARGDRPSTVFDDSPKEPPAPEPPHAIFRKVSFPSPVGNLAGYLTPVTDKQLHPAIIWITGGDCNSIGDLWHPAPADNDQTAAAYRKAGIVLFFPSLRGGNDNPGRREGFYGEVNDVLAAADYLARQPGVDPKRIYLGGHSTGGTTALLVGEYSSRFRAVFAFGPVSDVSYYGGQFVPAGLSDPKDIALRSPIHWLSSIQSPVFVFEGSARPGNAADLQEMSRASTNTQAHFFLIHGANHFSTLAPTNALIASKILADTGAQTNVGFSQEELDQPFTAGR